MKKLIKLNKTPKPEPKSLITVNVEKTEIERKISQFRETYLKLKKGLGEGSTLDKKFEIRLQSMLESLDSMLPVAEEQYLKFSNDRNAYAVNTIMNQMREIQNDLRNIRDLDQQVSYIIENIFTPCFYMLSQKINEQGLELMQALDERKPSKTTIRLRVESNLKEMAVLLQRTHESVQQEMIKYMTGGNKR